MARAKATQIGLSSETVPSSAAPHGRRQVLEAGPHLGRQQELDRAAEVSRGPAIQEDLAVGGQFVLLVALLQEPEDREEIRQNADAARRRLAGAGDFRCRALAARHDGEEVQFDGGFQCLGALKGADGVEEKRGGRLMLLHADSPGSGINAGVILL
jgi:hypothetical protein